MKTLLSILLWSALCLAGCSSVAPRPGKQVTEGTTGEQARWVQEYLKAHLKSVGPFHSGVIFSSDGQLGTFTDDVVNAGVPVWILGPGGHFNTKSGLNPSLELTLDVVSDQEVTLSYLWSRVGDFAGVEAVNVDRGQIKVSYFGRKPATP